MTTSQTSAILAVGVALGLAGGWVLWHRAPAPAAVAIADSARVDVAQLDTAEVDRHHVDAAAAAAVASANARAQRAEYSAAAAGRSAAQLSAAAQELAARIVRDSAQRDSLVRAIAAADTARQDQVHQLTSALEATRGALAIADARWRSADSAAQRAQQLLHVNLARLDAVTRMTRARPLWRRILHDGSCAGAGYAAAQKSAAGVVASGVVCAISG